jgi:hypothetical protein
MWYDAYEQSNVFGQVQTRAGCSGTPAKFNKAHWSDIDIASCVDSQLTQNRETLNQWRR